MSDFTPIVEALTEAARWSDMPAVHQLRFERFLRQLSGGERRLDPLPMPPKGDEM